MRAVLVAISLLLMGSSVAAAAPAAPIEPSGSWRPAIAVLPFTDRTDGAWLLWSGRDVGEGLARLVADSLARTARWRVPDSARVAAAFANRERRAALSDANALTLGASLGAELALAGTVLTFEVAETQPDPRFTRWGVGSGKRRTTATVVLELRLLDCAAGTVVRSATVKREQVSQSNSSAGGEREDPRAFAETPLGRATGEVVQASVRLLEEELTARTSVRVAQVTPRSVVLDAGRARGLARGQQLAVWRPELVTLDPADGTMIPESERVAAELIVVGFTDATGRRAICRLRRGHVQPGDRVRLMAAGTALTR